MAISPTAARRPWVGEIAVRGITKRFGSFTAVDHLDFTVRPGRVTGFLGPNGSGKTTTLRMLLGLITPTDGTATIDGHRYADIPNPLTVVGSALEATNFHPGRTGRDHLRVQAAVAGVPDRRVDELLELVGIPAAARKRAGGYSMGMRQRLGLAAALLGNPRVLILDEPSNGLDPEGIRWLRLFLRHLADEGRTLLVSSHLLSEVEQTVDDVVIIANGRRVAQGTVRELRGEPTAYVRTSDSERLRAALGAADLPAVPVPGGLRVTTEDLALVGDVALRAGLPIHELRAEQTHLEELFFTLTEQEGDRNRDVSGSPAGPRSSGSPWGPPATPPSGAPLDLPPPGAPAVPDRFGKATR
ncbi:MAG TPA: ATP-binding cassette domain-containing protein [Intrasporangium sp.]|uniref:ABC transporter ATP-binding protein n=1 Tax=Intrasporangium sp. TaxID=1925024 RepID=UPI002D79AF9D|nr:ATP-binding cassette domain-containing protein [Intrasporangium sp.]HET7399976.1 ATP-binding cassette domain-containing protein [Intrasporangium sp.]